MKYSKDDPPRWGRGDFVNVIGNRNLPERQPNPDIFGRIRVRSGSRKDKETFFGHKFMYVVGKIGQVCQRDFYHGDALGYAYLVRFDNNIKGVGTFLESELCDVATLSSEEDNYSIF